MTLFDAHCHLALPAFDADRDAVLARARDAGVTRIHVPGTSPDTWPSARALAACDGVVVGLGLHPWWVADASDDALDAALAALPDMLTSIGARSIGECGLDRGRARARTPSSLARQERAFVAQLSLSRATGLPIVLHVVAAHGRALALLEAQGPLPGGLVHGFTGAPEVAVRYVALGLHISFGRVLERPEARRAHASARDVPGHRMLVETDAPDHGDGGRRGEPAALASVVRALASLRGTAEAEIGAVCAENAARLFGLP